MRKGLYLSDKLSIFEQVWSQPWHPYESVYKIIDFLKSIQSFLLKVLMNEKLLNLMFDVWTEVLNHIIFDSVILIIIYRL